MRTEPNNRRPFCWLSDALRRRAQTNTTFAAQAQTALDVQAGAPAKPGSLTRCNLSLADLRPGECGYVARLDGTTQGRLRLLEMGLTPGTHVKVLRAAAFGGPLDIEVRNYQLSLRREEAASVWLGDAGATRPTFGAGAETEAAETKETGELS